MTTPETLDPVGLGQDAWDAPLAPGPLDATVEVPGSKSLTNRYLVLAALADAPGRLRGALRSRDTLLMAEALRALGVHLGSSCRVVSLGHEPRGEQGAGDSAEQHGGSP